MPPALSERQERQIIAALLLALSLALTWQAWWLSITVDEPSHLLSGYLYWRGRDRLYPRDMPPLIKLAGGWPTLFINIPVPADLGRRGDARPEWQQGSDLIARMASQPSKLQKFVFFCRLPLIVFPLLTTLLLWRWGRELFSPAAGLVVALLWVLCPTAIGHGSLFKNDHAATFSYLFFWYAAWRLWLNPGTRNALTVAAAGGLAAISKNSMLFLLALTPLILLARAFVSRRRSLSRIVLWVAIAVVIPWAILTASYQGELHWTSPAELSSMGSRSGAPPPWFLALANAFRWIPIPEGLWTGVVSLFASDAASVPVYMLGQIFPEGSRLYFPVATVLKMAVPIQLLFALGLIVLFRRKPGIADAFWLLPGFLYFGLASFSSLHLGVRLVLPAWSFFILITGAAAVWLLRTSMGRGALGTALGAMLILSAAAYPHGLAYFNPFVGGNANALRYLGDSNIDWGQSLRDVAAYAEEHRIEKLKLAYFGFDAPQRFFPPGRIEVVPVPWNEKITPTERYVPDRGWYAISASLLPGQFFLPQFREYFAEFRSRRPVAVAGGSIFIYRVD